MIVLADTGALYALIDRDDVWHQRIRDWWEQSADEVRVPTTVLPEIGYLLSRRLGPNAERAFVRALAEEQFAVEPLLSEDIARAADIMDAYADVPIGLVDASIAAMAERLEVRALLTTDRRHFALLRPHRGGAFRLAP